MLGTRDLRLIFDGGGAPVCVIRTSSVTLRRFGDVDEAFAWDEGEGDRTLAWWRAGHVRLFESIDNTVDDDAMMMLEYFEDV